MDLGRGEFAIVSNERGKVVGCLDLKATKPGLKGRRGLVFGAKRYEPDKTGIIVDYVHAVQVASMGGGGHGAT